MACGIGIGKPFITIGAQCGAQISDCVFILNSQASVAAFAKGNVTLGANIAVAAGPTGRHCEAAATATLAGIYAYSKTKGVFAGVALEGTVIATRKRCNRAFYGGSVDASSLLSGDIASPVAAGALYRMLDHKFGDLGVASMLADSEATLASEVDPPITIASISLRSLATNTPSLPSNPKPKKATAMYAYSSKEAFDIGFETGDTVWVEKEDISGWWTGI
jgi:hypothetical protein